MLAGYSEGYHALDALEALIAMSNLDNLCPSPGVARPGGVYTALVHGWDRIRTVHVYSLLGLSTHKNVKMLPNYDKVHETCLS